MKIEDKIYGSEEINEIVLCDLINSNSVQRLKDISQLGMPDKYSHVRGFSRYQHSVGVAILLKRLGAELEEQVAGVLHDISHTPFSHVIDWVFGDPTKEDYQDKIHKDFLRNSEIPEILKKHGFDLEKISDYSNFKLLERDAPSLCADRLDYSLRQMKNRHERGLTKRILDNLTVKENQIVFKRKEEAKMFGERYMALQTKQWAGDEMRSRYHLLSEALKRAFEKNLINFEDLKNTERPILKILNNSNDELIKKNLYLLRGEFIVIPDEKGIELKKKFRYIDPEVLINGKYVPLTNLSEDYSALIHLEKEKSKEIKKIKIISV